MKQCPRCSRTYTDETLNFCLDDGEWLAVGGPSGSDPETRIMPTDLSAVDASTRDRAHTTDATHILPRSGTGQETKGHHFDKRPLLVAAALVVLLSAGYFGYRAFKPLPSGQIDSIAVLPFENRSGEADSDYLSDGLADSLIYRLSQLPGLKVSPTTSVMRYKGHEGDVGKIARELGVSAVLSGRLMQRGDDLSISVQLVDAQSNTLVWAELYERKMSDLLATQREIATTIAQKLELKLSGREATGITKKYTNSNEAYQLYMKARYHANKRTKASMLQAVDYYRQAIALDPNFALAYARLAEVYLNLPWYPYASPNGTLPEGKQAAEKALELDPDLSEAHTFVGLYRVVFAWDWTEGGHEFLRAIELDPNSAEAHFRYGQVYLGPVGHYEEAIREFQRALDLEPLNVNARSNLAAVYLYAGQNELAVAQARDAYELEPGFPVAPFYLGLAYNASGKYDDAIALSEKVLQSDPTNQMMLRVAGYAYAMCGRRVEAERIIKKFAEIGRTDYVMSYWIANIYAALGDKEKAFAELEKSFINRDWELHRLRADPLMAPLRGDPRYANLLKRMNLPE